MNNNKTKSATKMAINLISTLFAIFIIGLMIGFAELSNSKFNSFPNYYLMVGLGFGLFLHWIFDFIDFMNSKTTTKRNMV